MLKLWRTITDITIGFATFEDAWTNFFNRLSVEMHNFIDNVQYFYRCSDQSSVMREQEYKTYINAMHIDGDEEILPTDLGESSHKIVTEADLIAVQGKECMDMELYVETAMHCAYEAGIFKWKYEIDTSVALAPLATTADNYVFQEWQKQLVEYTATGGNLILPGPISADCRWTSAEDDNHMMVGVLTYSSEEEIVGGPLWRILNQEQARAHDIVIDHLLRSTQYAATPPS
ncbi:hypothetical protein GYMLUDRAFT_242284 [Collybiopsis luxurians FD-317 M1]|uniref:Uncharacterized protein n=1 Tax=Collybiopsis luxurians FD-317 M1 TaxID=944289 RepID=A0A0D0D211_9AGAR|nr:hypothetical protein GYMLUDRAFT_242284 [Collybiopsis luxurians FD-317 M1]